MNNQSKLQQMGARDFYYYFKPNGRRLATICLIVQDGKLVARGASICSPEDTFLKRRGRAMACGRALQAITHEQNLLPVNPRRFRYGENDGLRLLTLTHKGSFLPQPANWFEERLLSKLKEA